MDRKLYFTIKKNSKKSNLTFYSWELVYYHPHPTRTSQTVCCPEKKITMILNFFIYQKKFTAVLLNLILGEVSWSRQCFISSREFQTFLFLNFERSSHWNFTTACIICLHFISFSVVVWITSGMLGFIRAFI